MPKPPLKDEYAMLEREIIEVLIVGHRKYRPDLGYPQSHSDMEGAVRDLLATFEVRRRPVKLSLDELVEPDLERRARLLGED